MEHKRAAATGKLLIVDDSKVSRMRIRTFFAAQRPAWDIQEASTGDEAIALAASFSPDYVTMDVNMPGMSGFEAADLLLMHNPKVRIVMLTSNVHESGKQIAAMRHIGFVAKPANETSLTQAFAFLAEG
jgi:DNA-binding NarL/FixJ family response regulator